MLKTTRRYSKFFFNLLKKAFIEVEKNYPYELKSISPCLETGKHKIQVKITGKTPSIFCFAEEIASDNNFLLGFSPIDIRTIVYLATSDKYEKILIDEKIKKTLTVTRSKSINNNKTIQLNDILTGKIHTIELNKFAESHFIERLDSADAYYLGYLAGQEQAWLSSARLKIINNTQREENP